MFFTLLTLTPELTLLHRQEFKTKYIPLVHDFIRCGESTLFTDSPIQWSIRSWKFPITMTQQPTFIHHVQDGKTTILELDKLSTYSKL